MQAEAPSQVKRLIPAMRWVLLAGCLLVLLAGVQLYVLTEHTADYFAWTINPPLTAAFLGAFYWTALVLAFLSARRQEWAQARIGVAGVFVFVSLTLTATLLHTDRFHFDSAKTSAAVAAWTWLVIYILDPLLVLVAGVLQLRAPGVDAPRGRRPPEWFRACLVVEGWTVLILGTTQFLAPTSVDHLWPWALSPLTSRAVASWLVGMGVILLQAVWEDDWRRIESGMNACVVLGVLQLVAVARYSDTLDWDAPRTWLYLAYVAALLATTVYGSLAARRSLREDLVPSSAPAR